MYVDTHAHIYLNHFTDDIDEVINRSLKNKVDRIYLPNIDRTTIKDVKKLQTLYPSICFGQMGLHPCSVKENFEDELKLMKKELEENTFYAIGETGIDLYWDKTFVDQQISAFKKQIEWSKDLNLPIVIHSRDSLDLTIKCIKEAQDGRLFGIFHCFNGSVEQAKQIIELGFFMGMGGVISFKNAGMDKVLNQVPLDNLVLETDAPYLAPVPFRGKRNEPSYIPHIAKKLAEIQNITLKEVAEITTKNANTVYLHTPQSIENESKA